MQDAFSGSKLEQDWDARQFASTDFFYFSSEALFACLRSMRQNIKNNIFSALWYNRFPVWDMYVVLLKLRGGEFLNFSTNGICLSQMKQKYQFPYFFPFLWYIFVSEIFN